MKRDGDLKWSQVILAANTPMLLRAGLVEGRRMDAQHGHALCGHRRSMLLGGQFGPGSGTILLSAGRLDFVTGFVAGPHAFRDQNTAAFCNYLLDP